MKLSDFDYELPEELIAQHPMDGVRAAGDRRRDGSRMLVHDIGRNRTEHGVIRDLERWLEPGDLLVLNDTRVLPSRLFARRATGGRVELLLLEPIDGQGRVAEGLGSTWRDVSSGSSAQDRRASRVGRRGGIGAASRETDGRGGEVGKAWHVALEPSPAGQASSEAVEERVRALLERVGHTPLPPYIHREHGEEPADREAYQTVYAERPGAVAAPTAGLHFTTELLQRLEARGVGRASVTLHVGHGTFLPVECEDVREHRMHAERFELPARTAAMVRATRRGGGRVVAVGTTSVRVLESCIDEDGGLRARKGETRLFLLPGKPLRVVDALLTNFHLPRSSLLMLVSAFAGTERVLGLYREAVRERYRFFSYGDAMLLMNARR